jgi:hypothetical protein
MKKIVASVGLVALGASGVHAASPSPLDSEAPKPWTLSVKLRGFYDDNYQSLPSGPLPAGEHRGSWGFDVSPGVAIELPLDQTMIKASYVYGFKYYEHKPIGNTENYDQDHTFNVSLDHTFNERYSISVRDSFVIGQEPDVLRAGNTYDTFQRIPGNNIRNAGGLDFTAQLTKQLGLAAGYANSYYDYASHGATLNNQVGPGGVTVTTVTPSDSGTLDRMEQVFHLDGRWQFRPTTIGIIGYQFSETGYTGDEYIGGTLTNAPGAPTSGELLRSNVRNNRSHYGYLGVDQTFTARLSASARAGARYNDYYNDPFSQSEPSPYFQASVKYAYMVGCTAEVGATYDRSATDLFSYTPGEGFTTDSQTLAAWLAVHHRITPRLTGTLTFQFQNSDYNGGVYNNEVDNYYLVGLNLEYRFNPHFSTELGYSYDLLGSNIPNRGFDRNRVYAGITASY